LNASLLVWLTPTLAAMFAWGIAQGLVKKYIGEVRPAHFCLYYAVASAAVNILFWASQDAPPILAPEGRVFLMVGLLAYVLEGIAWIFYYQSIVYGPISIVGTLSAAYPALTVIFANRFLGETLSPFQVVGVIGVIAGCLSLAYSPPDPAGKQTSKRWMPLAGAALLLWGVTGVLVKYAYAYYADSEANVASEANMALLIAVGGLLTLGVYGFIFGRKGAASGREWSRSFVPMATMALGGLLAAIAYKTGPASIVSPLSGAYPVVTLGFAWAVLRERPTALQWTGIVAILAGFVFTTMGAG
jgi:drug/metabolite transporter (DMT)-like permease